MSRVSAKNSIHSSSYLVLNITRAEEFVTFKKNGFDTNLITHFCKEIAKGL